MSGKQGKLYCGTGNILNQIYITRARRKRLLTEVAHFVVIISCLDNLQFFHLQLQCRAKMLTPRVDIDVKGTQFKVEVNY
ncbi:hypothetical protein J6590_090245 [Homalodisca vitripennis]|nr:hypothetical protein J6590_090245 [Homalodisca vitripennis]